MSAHQQLYFFMCRQVTVYVHVQVYGMQVHMYMYSCTVNNVIDKYKLLTVM